MPNIGTAPRVSVGRFSIAEIVTDVSVIADERSAELRRIGERIVLRAVTGVFAAAAALVGEVVEGHLPAIIQREFAWAGLRTSRSRLASLLTAGLAKLTATAC
jgi:hypothetical protein